MRRLILTLASLMLASMGALAFDDGFQRATPESQGVSSKAVAELFRKLDEGGYEVHGLMILRHDKVIAEHWWAPYAPEIRHAMYSNTKTYSATAIGFAVQEGLLSIEDRVMDFFPELVPANMPEQLPRLKVKHLLTMSAGHASMRYPGSGHEQVAAFLATDFAYEPGTSFAYDITCSHMLSHIITRVTGMTLYEYLKPRLLDPIGIGDVIWEMDVDGVNLGNGGQHSRTSDLAKMGTFLKNKGKWDGKQLLNSQWIEDMTTPHIYQNPQRSAEENANDDGSQGYGYQTWMGRCGSFRAIGASNQVTMVIPQYDLVVASQGSIRDENGFNSLIYEFAQTFSDKKLKEDKNFDLQAEIGGYALKLPFEAGRDSWTRKMCTARYNMHYNRLGIEKAGLRFDGAGNFYLTLETADAIHNMPFGLDSWKYGLTDRTVVSSRVVYTNTMGVSAYETAGYCSWASENVLKAYSLSMFNVNCADTFEIAFDGDNLVLKIGNDILSGFLIKSSLDEMSPILQMHYEK